MKVKLIAHTPEPEKIVYIAARTCYYKTPPIDVLEKELTDKEKNLIRRIIRSGHTSVIEHAYFTFIIEGISRAASHQLVRHRIASYSQQSQRYVKYEEGSTMTPPAISKLGEASALYKKFIADSEAVYKRLMEAGIPKEDCRFVLPSAVKTNLLVTMNARSLWNFFNLRCCERSQWEIRELAWLMLKEVKKAAPLLFENAGPWCFQGSCPENDEECRLKVAEKSRFKG